MKEICITFDMDWANDDVMKFFYEVVCELDICGTLNVTNDSSVLDLIRKEGRLELGIHPNFNRLLQNEEQYGSAETIIKELRQVVPEAVSARSHSLVTGSHISELFFENGIRYESNILYFPYWGGCLRCYKDYMGLIHVPFIFEDDVFLISRDKYAMAWYFENCESPVVFNFHPIHLFLNTENINRYEESKKYYHNYIQLKTYVNDQVQEGILDLLRSVVAVAREQGYCFRKMKDLKVQ